MKKPLYRILIQCIFLLSLVTMFAACSIGEALREAEAAKNLEITTPPLHDIPDGSYQGSYSAGLTSASVEATMTEGRISDMRLIEHNHGRGGDAETIIDAILQEQSLDIAAVSGATVSSKVILKSAELALTSRAR
ncbi:MAG: FMN-binding protein [Spirochaeta sp.]